MGRDGQTYRTRENGETGLQDERERGERQTNMQDEREGGKTDRTREGVRGETDIQDERKGGGDRQDERGGWHWESDRHTLYRTRETRRADRHRTRERAGR